MKLDDLDELTLRDFVDHRGKKILEQLLGHVLKNQQASLLSYPVSDEAAERRLIVLKHQLTGAELLYRTFMAEVEKYGKELKK